MVPATVPGKYEAPPPDVLMSDNPDALYRCPVTVYPPRENVHPEETIKLLFDAYAKAPDTVMLAVTVMVRELQTISAFWSAKKWEIALSAME